MMFGKQNALASYGKVANAETDPLRQIVMLYDGAVKFIRLTAADIASGDLVAKAEHSNRVLDIIGYLQSILDFERGAEAAAVLDNLYTQVTVQVLRASAALDAEAMLRTADLLLPVRDSWETAARTGALASVAAPADLPAASYAKPTSPAPHPSL